MALKYGRNSPVARFPRLKLKNYINSNTLPSIPASMDYSNGCSVALGEMYNNDQLSDCVIACVEHLEGVLTGDASDNNTTSNSQPLLFTSNQTISFYSAACGYNPSIPSSDQGCDIQTVLSYWENNGSPKGSTHKIAGTISIDPANTVEINTALYYFQNLIFGIDMSCADVEDQCLGCKWELDGPEKHAGLLLKAAETAYNSGYIVAKFYERPADFNEWDKRGKLADKWYEYFTQPAQAGLNNE